MARKPYESPTYGVRHVMEDGMRETGAGVFGSLQAKAVKAAPENKMEGQPDNKAEVSMSMTKAELLALASAEGVAVETDDNKDDLIRKIKKARR